MAAHFTITRRVAFGETDMAGIVHFSNFFRYMEDTEHAFFRSLGFSIQQRIEDQLIGWPRVEAQCSFRSPLRFEDEVEIELTIDAIKTRSITYDFVFRRLQQDEKIEVARGRTTTVCTALNQGGEPMRAAPIPATLRERLEAARNEDKSQKVSGDQS